MVEISAVVTHGWFVLLLSVIASLLIFPLVIAASFVYDYLEKRNEKTPKVLLMLLCTFLATLAAVLLVEVYLGFTLAQVFSTS